jgi:SAM-dependent methyltransferase
MYDYYLGGKDNFPADREAAERVIATGIRAREFARANRAFLGRAVRFLSDRGITQFLDIGTGIPTVGNTHEVAQETDPAATVVYVDNDPIVLAHARALMAGHGRGATTVIQADLRDPEAILSHPKVRAAIDFDRPIGLILVAVLHFVREDEDPDGIVKLLRDALPVGSYLVMSHGTGGEPESETAGRMERIAEVYKERSSSSLTLRDRDRIGEFFGDVELVEPGLVSAPRWRPVDPITDDVVYQVTAVYGGVGRKV